MADIVTNTLQIGNDKLILRDADAQEKITGLKEDLSESVGDLKNAITTKAEQDGAYSDLTAGQLLSKNEASDSVPYNFRAVGHDATLEYIDAIVGGSVVGNQCVISVNAYAEVYGITRTLVKDGYVRVSGTSTRETNFTIAILGANTIVNHVYLFDLNGDSIPSGCSINVKSGATVTVIKVWTSLESFGITIPVGTTIDAVLAPQAFDLTKMFGITIADYVYTLETATAGSGVAWLKKHFPKLFTYQEYNAGEIVSVQGLSQHVTVGFNQWDEEWEVGSLILITGEPTNATDRIRSKNFSRCISNTVYYATKRIAFFFYDSGKNFINYAYNDNTTKLITTPANATYFKVLVEGTTTYNHDICINLSDPTRNGTYEPYQKRTYPLDSTKTFRGIFKLDNNNQLYADGDRYLPDGTVQRRYGEITFNGSEKWKTNGSSGVYIFISDISAKPKAFGNIISEKYVKLPSGDAPTQDGYFNFNITGNALQFRDGNAMNETSWKAMLAQNPLKMIYELATTTTETADPYTVPQIVDPDGTEEYVSTSVVPVRHESRYPLDIAGTLDKILTMPTANGTYTLRATVNNGAVTYAWVST